MGFLFVFSVNHTFETLQAPLINLLMYHLAGQDVPILRYLIRVLPSPVYVLYHGKHLAGRAEAPTRMCIVEISIMRRLCFQPCLSL
jgi:hypothetical protein